MRPRGGVFLAGVLAALSQVFLLADCRVLLPISLAGRATSLVELRTAAASAQRDQGSNAAAAPGGASAKDEDEDTSDSAAEESHAEEKKASRAEEHSASKDQQSESEAASEKYSQSSEAAESRTSQSASQSAADASGSQASQNSATPSAMAKDEEDRKAEKKVDSGEAADAVHGTEHSQAAPAEEAAQAAAAPSLERFAHPEQSSTREQSVALHEHAESAAPQEAAAEHPSALRDCFVWLPISASDCVLMHNKIRTARLDQWPDSLIADDTLSEAARSRAKAFIANNCKNPDGTELDSLQELMMPKTGTACDALNYVFLDGLSDLERVVKEDSPGTYTPGDSASPWHSENAQKFALMLSETGKAVGCAATVGCTADVVFCMYSPALSVGGTPVSSHYFKALKKRSKVEAHGEEFLPGGVAEHEVKSVAGARIAPSESSATVSYYTAAVPAVVSFLVLALSSTVLVM
ncbi:SAG family member [Cyclospora cayetanensis]|uniref:SAG family member n=1 Tax=Cyclospora cayetanensis TaxID=88456 RepID=A0A1D3CS63_9EIME|nr:SAG family member [Cyclospora cayetanensis]